MADGDRCYETKKKSGLKVFKLDEDEVSIDIFIR